MIDEKKLEDFIAYYNTLEEGEKFKVGGAFTKATGGKLSPYDSPTPVSVGLIQIQDGDEIKLLGVIRGIPPGVGENAFPGGFVDKLESIFAAAAREVLEETGLETDPNDYEFVNSATTERNVTLMFFMNKNIYPKEILNTLTINSEVLGFVLIDKNTPMVFPLHKAEATSFFEAQANKKLIVVKSKNKIG